MSAKTNWCSGAGTRVASGHPYRYRTTSSSPGSRNGRPPTGPVRATDSTPTPAAMTLKQPWLAVHPLSQEDALAATALRASVAAVKGKLAGTAARGPFDAVMERVAVPAGVTFEADTVGGISGWWAKPARPRNGAAIIHVHGGWVNLGTAPGDRNFVGPVPSGAGAGGFGPRYRAHPSARV